MQSEQSQQITKRFFEAIKELKKRKITTKNKFSIKYGINTRNFWKLEKNMEKDILQLHWLQILVTDYNISADWLLTGRGEIIQ